MRCLAGRWLGCWAWGEGVVPDAGRPHISIVIPEKSGFQIRSPATRNLTAQQASLNSYRHGNDGLAVWNEYGSGGVLVGCQIGVIACPLMLFSDTAHL